MRWEGWEAWEGRGRAQLAKQELQRPGGRPAAAAPREAGLRCRLHLGAQTRRAYPPLPPCQVYEEVRQEFEKRGAYFLGEAEKEKVRSKIMVGEGGAQR